MAIRNEQEELIFKAQGITEALELLSKYEDVLQGMLDAAGDSDLIKAFEGLSPRLSDIQSRFKPHLSTLGLVAAQLNVMQARLEDGKATPTGAEMNAVTNALANLQSELRKAHADIERYDKWVSTQTSDLLIEIAALTESLDAVKRIFEFSNSLRSDETQAEIFRETVVKLLSATIEELTAPAVSVNRLSGITGMLKKVLEKSVEKKLGEAVDGALDEAVSQSGRVVEVAKELPHLDGLF